MFSFQMASRSSVRRYFVETAAFAADLLCISPGHGYQRTKLDVFASCRAGWWNTCVYKALELAVRRSVLQGLPGFVPYLWEQCLSISGGFQRKEQV